MFKLRYFGVPGSTWVVLVSSTGAFLYTDQEAEIPPEGIWFYRNENAEVTGTYNVTFNCYYEKPSKNVFVVSYFWPATITSPVPIFHLSIILAGVKTLPWTS